MKKILLLVALFTIPAIAFAQFGEGGNNQDLGDLGQEFTDIINNIAVPLIFALAFVIFIWGVFKYFIMGGGDEEAREKGRDLMIWGLLGFFFMISVWGLVNLVVNTIDLEQRGAPDENDLPDAPGVRDSN